MTSRGMWVHSLEWKQQSFMFREEKVIRDQLSPVMRLLVEWVIIYMFFHQKLPHESSLYYASDKDLALNPFESAPPSMQVVWPSTFNVLAVIILLLTLVVVKNVNDVFPGALPERQYQNLNGVYLDELPWLGIF